MSYSLTGLFLISKDHYLINKNALHSKILRVIA